ncbi:MAG: hypothetical protein ACHQFZ_05410 [Acidimicrobiales bacterium]
MKRDAGSLAGLLRWYPESWRRRYGEELVALMSDDLEGRPPTLGYRWRVAAAGLVERAHGAGLTGNTATPAERRRAGSLVVLASWCAMVVAGSSFAKISEHFARAMPVASRAQPQVAFDVVVILAAAGALIVAAGAAVACPAFGRFLRDGGGTAVRRRVARALIPTLLAGGSLYPLAHWAHHLSNVQRNGGDAVYAMVLLAWALTVVAALVLWTTFAVAIARRLALSGRALRVESRLAVALSAVMVGLTAAVAVWWWSVATVAPWFLSGAPAGSTGSPAPINLVLTMGLMASSLIAAAFGVSRVASSRSTIVRGVPGAR